LVSGLKKAKKTLSSGLKCRIMHPRALVVLAMCGTTGAAQSFETIDTGSLLMFATATFTNGTGSLTQFRMTRVDYASTRDPQGVVPYQTSEPYNCSTGSWVPSMDCSSTGFPCKNNSICCKDPSSIKPVGACYKVAACKDINDPTVVSTCAVTNTALGRQLPLPSLSHAYVQIQLSGNTPWQIFQYEYNDTHVSLANSCQLPWHFDCGKFKDCVVWQALFYDSNTDILYGTAAQGRAAADSMIYEIGLSAQPAGASIDVPLPCHVTNTQRMPIGLISPVHAAFDSRRSSLYYGHDGRAPAGTFAAVSIPSLTIGPVLNLRPQGEKVAMLGDDHIVLGPYLCNHKKRRCLLKLEILPNGTLVESGDAVAYPGVISTNTSEPPVPLYAVSRKASVVVFGLYDNDHGGWSNTIDAFDATCDFCNATKLMPTKRLAHGCIIVDGGLHERLLNPTDGETFSCSVGGWLLSDV
jgi:hypothetical protein